MTVLRLNKTNVDALQPPESGQVLHWDDKDRGFGIRVTRTEKTYVAETRVKGKKRRVAIGRHGTISAEVAREAARQVLSKMALGTDPNAEKIEEKARTVTLAEVYASFKEARELRPKTVEIYDSVMRRCFGDWQAKQITAITEDMIQARCLEIAKANGPRGIGKAQAHQAMRTLRTVLNYASAVYKHTDGRRILPNNPVNRLKEARLWNQIRVPRRKSVIKDHQLKVWYREVMKLDNVIHRDYLILCLFTGLRSKEAKTLKWPDIDMQAKTLRVREENSKTHEEHLLPLTDFHLQLLSDRVRKLGNDYVFPGAGKHGHMIEPKGSIKKVVDKSGVAFSSHDLRRTIETTAEGLDISYYALKRLLNHTMSGDVTAGYIVSDVERLREPMEKVTARLLVSCGVRPAEPSSAIASPETSIG